MSLIIKGLNQTLGGITILKDINLKFNPGEMTVISGPNGSGKTTLIKSIMKLYPVNKETIYIHNNDINNLSIRDRAKIIGYVPQFSNSDFDFTVYETIEMGRYPLKFQWNNGSNKKEVNRVMELTGVTQLMDRRINSLSGGELQRVLLARSLVVNPSYLILDEPSSNLDISHNLEIMKLIKQITIDMNITTIMVLHDLNTIFRFANNVVLLKEGLVKYKGLAKDVLTSSNIKNIFDVDTDFIEDSRGLKHIIINSLV